MSKYATGDNFWEHGPGVLLICLAGMLGVAVLSYLVYWVVQ